MFKFMDQDEGAKQTQTTGTPGSCITPPPLPNDKEAFI